MPIEGNGRSKKEKCCCLYQDLNSQLPGICETKQSDKFVDARTLPKDGSVQCSSTEEMRIQSHQDDPSVTESSTNLFIRLGHKIGSDDSRHRP